MSQSRTGVDYARKWTGLESELGEKADIVAEAQEWEMDAILALNPKDFSVETRDDLKADQWLIRKHRASRALVKADRTSAGTLTKGNPGGPGRKPAALVREYKEAYQRIFTLDKWEEMLEKMLRDGLDTDDAYVRMNIVRFMDSKIASMENELREQMASGIFKVLEEMERGNNESEIVLGEYSVVEE